MGRVSTCFSLFVQKAGEKLGVMVRLEDLPATSFALAGLQATELLMGRADLKTFRVTLHD